jgi:D-arabinonate dehydratase
VAEHEIKSVEVRILEVPLGRDFWMSQQAYATAGQVFVTLRTSEGVLGYGQAHGNPMGQIVDAIERLAPLVIGRSVWGVRGLWHDLFTTMTSSREAVATGQPHFGDRGRYQVMSAIAALDIAIWDARSKVAQQPLWRFLGGTDPVVPAYATGGYYPSEKDDELGIQELLEEIGECVDAGFTAFKMKVGRRPENDIKRVAAVRMQFPELRIMVDANGGWSYQEALEAAHGFVDQDVFWVEEPLQWHYPDRYLKQLRLETGISIASGEQEMHPWGAKTLVDEADLSYLQTDCTRAGGLTAWMDAANYAALRGVGIAPHHDGHIHGHYLATLSGPRYCETFPNERRDPLWAGLYHQRPTLENGVLVLNESPGLGIEPDADQLDSWTVHKRNLQEA